MHKLWQRYINYTMLFLLLYATTVVVISSYILWFVLPAGGGMHGVNLEHCVLNGMGPTGNNVSVFGYPRFQWVDIHSWVSIAMVVILWFTNAALALDC